VTDNLVHLSLLYTYFFFTKTPPPDLYTLSLHDALPISNVPTLRATQPGGTFGQGRPGVPCERERKPRYPLRFRRRLSFGENEERSEEHTSELQSRGHLVCRLLLEKKK